VEAVPEEVALEEVEDGKSLINKYFIFIKINL